MPQKSSRSFRNFDWAFLWWIRWLLRFKRARRAKPLFPKCVGCDTSLSGFWFKGIQPRTKEELDFTLHQAMKALESLGRIFNNDKSFTLKLAPSDEAASVNLSSRTVRLDPRILLYPNLPFTLNLDIAAGLVIHELSHIRWTDHDFLKKAKQKGALFENIFNFIEDERIERCAIKEAPGFAGFLQKTHRFLLAPASKRILSSVFRSRKRWESLLAALFLLVRSPDRLPLSWLLRFRKELYYAYSVLTPFPSSCKKAFLATERLLELFSEHEKEAFKKSQLKRLFSVLIDHNWAQELKQTEMLPSALTNPGDRKIKGPAKKTGGFGIPPDSELNLDGPIVFEEPDSNGAEKEYEEALRAVKTLIYKVRRAFEASVMDEKEKLKGVPSGRIMKRTLARALTSTRIFMRESRTRPPEIAAVILIDQSGSMAGKKIEMAKQAAILLHEALSSCSKVRLYIYGHTADLAKWGRGSTVIFKYVTPSAKRNAKALGRLRAFANNRDGVAIAAVAQDVDSDIAKNGYTIMKKILLCLTDGAPAAHGYGGKACIRHTREVIEIAEKHGWEIIGIAIPPYLPPNKLFSKSIVINEVEELPSQLVKVLQKIMF